LIPAGGEQGLGPVTVRCPVALIDMAAAIGVEPKTLHRTLGQLRADGALERGRNERVFTFTPRMLAASTDLDDDSVTAVT
jgi:DNA-binding IclR family transcriptional regulator